ncbi:uncharacterized protein LOC130194944 [Pseudoliparis swirei]|uniref:uncharacterized protein LOC130194944 n=1 Tax=Pseudoliparis swirei TaxID=2059687 RepID=UPI0024BDF008|nr:uncharacterized protein LOC130194944 [Pseudoliparis swirei]
MSTQMLLDIVSRPSSSPPKRPGTSGRKERSSPTPHRSCSTRPRPWPRREASSSRRPRPSASCVWESWWFHSPVWKCSVPLARQRCGLHEVHAGQAQTGDNKQTKGKVGNQWVKDFLTEDAESFPQVSSLLEAHIDRCIYGQRGFEHHTFQEMWELYSQYLAQEDRPEQVSAEQRELTQKAHSSVRRWLHTPVTHITSVQMKRFRRFIKEKDQVSTRCDVSSWPNDEAELVAASQAVEDLLNSEEAARLGKTSSHSQGSCPTEGTKQPKQPDPTVRRKQHEPAILGEVYAVQAEGWRNSPQQWT